MNWEEKENSLIKTFRFTDFKSALEFVNKVGDIAEGLNHHPEIVLSWGKVKITTTTHDKGNIITEKDTKLTKEIDNIK
jgi:4a-hydroxytetrahydrobiopterin dehydratase